MAFDFRKEYKEFYMPKGTPSIVTVPKMNYIAVRGSGNPNDEDGEYKMYADDSFKDNFDAWLDDVTASSSPAALP